VLNSARLKVRNAIERLERTGVCTENLNPDIVVMKTAKDRA
jgi:hypothetical protein